MYGKRGENMAHAFYPFVEDHEGEKELDSQDKLDSKDKTVSDSTSKNDVLLPHYAARIAVFDATNAAPRVVVIEPCNVRDYLEEITQQVTKLASEQGGTIPFMVIREIVENFIHAYFIEPSISILDKGMTIRFADQGPGIKEKDKALDFGTTSATTEMKRYIRGVGSGLPYVREYMKSTHGFLDVEDNINGGTIVTLCAQSDTQYSRKTYDKTPTVNTHPGVQGYTTHQPMDSVQNYEVNELDAFNRAYQANTNYPVNVYTPYSTKQTPTRYAPLYQQTYQQIPPQEYQQTPLQDYLQQQAQAAYPMQIQQPQATSPLSTLPLTARQEQVLKCAQTYGYVGPTELTKLYGLSQPTWSRELKALEDMGILHKNPKEQKRVITKLGYAYINSHLQQ